MKFSLLDVRDEVIETLNHWKIESDRYSLNLRQDQLEIWTFDIYQTGRSPCRILITPTDETLTEPNMSTPEFYIDFATADDSYTYKVKSYSRSRLVKMLIVLWWGQRDLGVSAPLLHRSDKGFSQKELAKRRRQ